MGRMKSKRKRNGQEKNNNSEEHAEIAEECCAGGGGSLWAGGRPAAAAARRSCCCDGGRRSLPVARRRQAAVLMRAPAGCCVCGVCGALDRAIGNGEEEIREDSKNRKGELTGDCSRRSSLPAGGGSSPVTAIGGARAGGRAWSG